MPINKSGVEIPASVLYYQSRTKKVPFRKLASDNDLTVGQVAGAIRTYDPNEKKEEEPQFMKYTLGQREVFDDENCIVVGDVQLPTTDWEFAKLPAEIAKKHIKGDKILYIVGDWANADAFSRYENIVSLPSWNDEKEASRYLLSYYLSIFDLIKIFPGNHERRRQKFMGGQDSKLDGLMDELLPKEGRDRILFSNFDRCTINNSTGKWTLLHGKNYSQNPLMNSNKYAQKFQSHIISHHEHKYAIGMSKFGGYYIIDNGGLFDREKMAYVQLDTSTSPEMAQGFTMLKNGHPYPFADFTDWNYWL